MNDCNLIDIGYNGHTYTWTNKRKNNPIYERLDRGWANDEWIQTFPEHNVWHLPRITSDHYPILVKLKNENPPVGPKSFRFELIWTLDKDYLQIVNQAWFSHIHFEEKLGATRSALTDWNRTYFRNVYARKNYITARLNGTQTYLLNNPFSGYHQDLEANLQKD